MQRLYAILCIAGALLPLSQFVPWLVDHGLDVPLLVQQAVSLPVAAFAWSDVAVSAVVLVVFVIAEGRRIGMPHAWRPLLGLAVGVSLALALVPVAARAASAGPCRGDRRHAVGRPGLRLNGGGRAAA